MRKAVFLDRDGVLNQERGYTFAPSDFHLLPDVGIQLKKLQDLGFLLIVISNQGGIGKGIYSKAEVEVLHQILKDELKQNGVFFSEIYYCPHYPSNSNCICRKPDSLFIEKSLARFSIDPEKSFFIGDKERDVAAAQKAGVRGVLIESNTSLSQLWKLGLI